MFKENAYVISGGPTSRSLPDLLLAIGKSPRQQCFLQRYCREPSGAFAKSFAHSIRINFCPTFCQKRPESHNGFCVSLRGNVEAIYDLDKVSGSDAVIALLQNPELETQLSYDPERGLGIIEDISCTHNWTDQDAVLPHLLTAINLSLPKLASLPKPQTLSNNGRVIPLPSPPLRILKN